MSFGFQVPPETRALYTTRWQVNIVVHEVEVAVTRLRQNSLELFISSCKTATASNSHLTSIVLTSHPTSPKEHKNTLSPPIHSTITLPSTQLPNTLLKRKNAPQPSTHHAQAPHHPPPPPPHTLLTTASALPVPITVSLPDSQVCSGTL